MPLAHLKGHLCGGHSCWPPRPNAEGSPNVRVNGIPIHRQGDGWMAHTCPEIPETHSGSLSGGSATVRINGKGAARVGDGVSCGSTASGHSNNVNIGG